MLDYFYHRVIRKSIISFGVLFKNIYVSRYDTNQNEIERIKVPLAYGPKQKFIVRNDSSDPNLVRNIDMNLPRMGFEMVSLVYDQSRKTASVTRLYDQSSRYPTTGLKSSFVPVPYNLNVALHVVCKNTDDMLQIVEQILPYFTPDFSVTIDEISINRKVEVSIAIGDVQFMENYEGDFEERKAFICSMNFIMRINLIGPAIEAKVIKEAEVSFYDRYALEDYLSGLTTYNLLETIRVSVTGGATAGSFGPTGTYEINITGPYG